MTIAPLSALNSYLPKDALAQKKQDDSWKARRIDEAADEFESQFLSLMIENMFTGLDSEGMFGGGHAETIYRGFMADEYAKAITAQGGIGLSDSVRAQLLGLQQEPEALIDGDNDA